MTCNHWPGQQSCGVCGAGNDKELLIEALEAFVNNALIFEYSRRVEVDEWVLSKARAALRFVYAGTALQHDPR